MAGISSHHVPHTIRDVQHTLVEPRGIVQHSYVYRVVGINGLEYVAHHIMDSVRKHTKHFAFDVEHQRYERQEVPGMRPEATSPALYAAPVGLNSSSCAVA